MSIDELQVLIEIGEGEYHANQCTRRQDSRDHKHDSMGDACKSLEAKGYAWFVGNELMLTNAGREVVDHITNSISL